MFSLAYFILAFHAAATLLWLINCGIGACIATSHRVSNYKELSQAA